MASWFSFNSQPPTRPDGPESYLSSVVLSIRREAWPDGQQSLAIAADWSQRPWHVNHVTKFFYISRFPSTTNFGSKKEIKKLGSYPTLQSIWNPRSQRSVEPSGCLLFLLGVNRSHHAPRPGESALSTWKKTTFDFFFNSTFSSLYDDECFHIKGKSSRYAWWPLANVGHVGRLVSLLNGQN